MTTMSDLSDFLLARIDDDETVAREASLLPEGVQRVSKDLPDRGLGFVAVDETGEESLPLVPTSPDSPGAEPLGDWGWSGGPVDYDSPEARRIAEIFGQAPNPGVEVRDYQVHDSGAWDEEEPTGASYYVASVPGRSRGVARHIARWSPLRVLAECEAKRRIVNGLDYADGYDDPNAPVINAPWFLHLLALPYADHPDYREEWRP